MGEIDALAKIRLGLTSSLWTEEQADSLAQELYDAVAHELAEEIRSLAKATAKPGSIGHAGLSSAANLIDPEVSK